MTNQPPFVSSEVETPAITADTKSADAIREILAQTKGPGNFKNLLLYVPKDKDGSNSALIAASQASEATTELLRFHREGPQAYSAFGDVEAVCKLAEALKLACEIELAHLDRPELLKEAVADLQTLAAAAGRYIEGWAG